MSFLVKGTLTELHEAHLHLISVHMSKKKFQGALGSSQNQEIVINRHLDALEAQT